MLTPQSARASTRRLLVANRPIVDVHASAGETGDVRWWLAMLGACSFTPGTPRATGQPGPSDAAGADTRAYRDAALPDASPAPFALSGMRWSIPCTSAGGATATACACAQTSPGYTTVVTLGGAASDHWLVTARIAGAMEGLRFANGTATSGSQWYVGGDTGGDGGDNYYELTVTSPAQHYYLNNAPSGNAYSVAMDYEVQLVIDGDATVTFTANPQDIYQWQGVDSSSQPITLSSVIAPPPFQNMYGQWAYFVVSAATLQ
jgi:hypothetical protein